MTAATIPAHLRHLPVQRGLPVPWVAIWSSETNPGDVDVTWNHRLGQPVVTGPVELRFGLYWVNGPLTPSREGTVEFGATSSSRQRDCMLRPRCQVCGERIRRKPFWIIPADGGWVEEVTARRPRTMETKQPPVCGACYETAPLWCPHLRHAPWVGLRAYGRPVGAGGDLITPTGFETGFVVDLDDDDRRLVLGRELIVKLEQTEWLQQ